jgi:hypothetical protein
MALFWMGVGHELWRWPEVSQNPTYLSARKNLAKGLKMALEGKPCPKNGAAKLGWEAFKIILRGRANLSFHTRRGRAQKLGADSQEAPPKSLSSSPGVGGKGGENGGRPMFGKGSRGGLRKRDRDRVSD